MTEKKLFPSFVCEGNGFPQEMIILAGKDEYGKAIRKNPDESPHVHKSKLARGYQAQRVPMTQPLSSTNQNQKTKDEMIAQYHQENQEGYAEYRKVMQEQVIATKALAMSNNTMAEAILELARAIKSTNIMRGVEKE